QNLIIDYRNYIPTHINYFFLQAEDGIRDGHVTGVQTCALPILHEPSGELVVQDGKVLIVDEFTGRLMHGRRWSEGLHQAVEAKRSEERRVGKEWRGGRWRLLIDKTTNGER